MTDTAKEPADPFLAHEALDRCGVILAMVSDHLYEHPYVQQDAEVLSRIQTAMEYLGQAYQLIGGARHESHPRDPSTGGA